MSAIVDADGNELPDPPERHRFGIFRVPDDGFLTVARIGKASKWPDGGHCCWFR